MHGKTSPGVRYDARLPFLENDRTPRLERLWRFERDVARARAQGGPSAERALDWLVMLSRARDWSQGMGPDVAANTGFSRLTGYSEDEVVGQSPGMLQGEDTDSDPKAHIRKAIDRRKGGSTTLINYRKNGTAYDCELTISPIRNEEGDVANAATPI